MGEYLPIPQFVILVTAKGEIPWRVLDGATALRPRLYRTTAWDIARDAGVSGTLAYAYFPNKEALFLAAVDEDAAAVIHEGLSSLVDSADLADWREQLIFTLLAAVEHHPLAKRLLAGLEPDVTERVLEIPALTELRKACIERLRSDQLEGRVRSEIDPVAVGNGVVANVSLLMSRRAARAATQPPPTAPTSVPCSRAALTLGAASRGAPPRSWDTTSSRSQSRYR